jgi:hypothetical protein
MPLVLDTSAPYFSAVLATAAPRESSIPPVMVSEVAVHISEVRCGGRIFRLSESIILKRSAENGLIYIESRPLSILSYGSSVLEAVYSFCEDFATMWDVIAQDDDNTLTEDARQVKRYLTGLVKDVVPE